MREKAYEEWKKEKELQKMHRKTLKLLSTEPFSTSPICGEENWVERELDGDIEQQKERMFC